MEIPVANFAPLLQISSSVHGLMCNASGLWCHKPHVPACMEVFPVPGGSTLKHAVLLCLGSPQTRSSVAVSSSGLLVWEKINWRYHSIVIISPPEALG